MKWRLYLDWRKGLVKVLMVIVGGLTLTAWSIFSNVGILIALLGVVEWWFILLGMLVLLVVFETWDWVEAALGAIAGKRKNIVIPFVLYGMALIIFLAYEHTSYFFGFWFILATILIVNGRLQDYCDRLWQVRHLHKTRQSNEGAK
jgi:hypothetical protein